MGVLGLWQILESIGHPIKIDGLEGKRLSVDANVWLYKFIRGFREKDAPVNIDSHKLGLYNRILKLLYYKIKPIFVFDGPAPILKRRTLEKRQNVRNKQFEKVQDAAMKLLAQQLKMQYPDANFDNIKITIPDLRSYNLAAAEKLTDDDRDLFYLPPEPSSSHEKCEAETKPDIIQEDSDIEDDIFFVTEKKPTVDINSKDFKELPPEIRYEILHEVKESKRRIRNEYALPDDAESFSNLQLSRLKARRKIQQKIEECEKDICSMYTGDFVTTYRVQSDATSTMLLVKNTDIREKTASKTDTHQEPAPAVKSDQESETDADTVLDQFELVQPLTTTSPQCPSPTLASIKVQAPVPKLITTSKLPAISDFSSSPELSPASTSVSIPDAPSSPTLTPPQISVTELSGSPPQSPQSSVVSVVEDISAIPETPKLSTTIELSPSPKPTSRTSSICLSPTTAPAPVWSPKLCTTVDLSSSPEISRSPSPVPVQIAEPTIPEPTETQPQDPTPSTSISQPLEPVSVQVEDVNQQTKNRQVPLSGIGRDQMRVIDDTKRQTNKVTSKIIEDAKELLRLFGIPYIDAAGEAEAQCATLERLKLTEGTITDDSDVWLFGAQNVFRYFFSDDKYVMQYKMPDIEFHLRLTRENLVCFAMLVGSDYTEGVLNVGPVTALEILSEFPGESIEPLVKFRKWKDSYVKSKDRIPGSKKREKLLKFNLPEEFPSRAVFDGYMRPQVDNSTEQFTWGTPELDELREYARRNFGWDIQKIDEKLLPVMKRLNERRTQTTIDSFFFKTAANQNPELFRSKRVNEALSKIATRTNDLNETVVLTESSSDDDQQRDDERSKKVSNVGGQKRRQTGVKTTKAQRLNQTRAKRKSLATKEEEAEANNRKTKKAIRKK